MGLENFLLIAIVVSLPINWWATWQFWSLSKDRPDIVSLRERAVTATVLSVTITVFALITTLTEVGVIDPESSVFIRRAFLVILSLSVLYWFWVVRGR